MKYLLPVLLFLTIVSSVEAAPAIVHRYNTTGSGTITSTGSGNTFVVVWDSSTVGTSSTFNAGGSFTKLFCLTNSSSSICAWIVNSTTSGKTSVSCTGCGTINAFHGWEISGTDTTTPLDHLAPCTSASNVCLSPSNKLTFNPGFSAEAVLFAGNCSASASSFSGTGVTWTSAFPNGEPGADGITSAAGTITGAPDSGCGNAGGMIIGIKGSGATLSCTADVGFFDYSAQGSAGTHPVITANIVKTGDLIALSAWCITTCGAGSITVGSDTAVQTSVSGTSNANSGQPFLFYDLASSASGSVTITWTPTGSWTNDQLAYEEFIPSAGCTFSHDVDSSLGTGTGTAMNTPSITPTTGDILYNFTAATTHTTAIGTPWVANDYRLAGETNNQFFITTINSQSYVLSASAGSTSNNQTQLNSNPWEALITSFKLSGPAAAGIAHGHGLIF
jgi:hypothetical protein